MRLLILIGLISFNFTYAQMASSVTVRGVEYQFVGDSNAKYRVSGDYSSIVADDPNTYLDVFIRDAILNGKDLNLAHNNSNTYNIRYGYNIAARMNSIRLVPSRFYNSGRIGGSSCLAPGTAGFIITINEFIWGNFSDREKLSLIYHEFGHALLQYGHICHSTRGLVPSGDSGRAWAWITTRAIMATAECLETYGVYYGDVFEPRPGPGYEILGWNCLDDYPGHCDDWGLDFRDLNDLMNNFYTETTPIGDIRNSISSKNGGIISPIHD